MNKFLQSRAEIDNCTKYLQDNGLNESGLSCKNWDAANVLPYLRDGNILDMGSSGSIILENAVRKNLVGLKTGIDLAYPENVSSPEGINLMRGDLMDTGLPDGIYNFITCMSVIEHFVDIEKFVKECSRLLAGGGQVFVSFDYWPEKIQTKGLLLYNLDWNILCKEDVEEMIIIFKENGLELSGEVDWTIQDAVINDAYCSPFPKISYSFGILHFIKA